MNRRTYLIALLIVSAVLVGCDQGVRPREEKPSVVRPEEQIAATETPSGPLPTREETFEIVEKAPPSRGEDYIVHRAVLDLMQRLAVPEDAVEVTSVEAIEWSDASLGCPEAEMDYAQVITPGFKILLEADGESYWYHTDEGKFMVFCGEDGLRFSPVILIQPGERIQDGEPWMPVD